jgi:small subunit ribosomal protein S16
MVRIRLRRMGKTKQPSYRVVVADSRSPRDGKFIEIIGYYEPIRQPKVLHIKQDRARYWLGVGAQPSETVVHLLKQVNILDAEGNILPAAAEDEAAEAAAGSQPAASEATTPAEATDETAGEAEASAAASETEEEEAIAS